VHYFFYSRPQFQALIDQGEFLEWAEFAGNLYGTPRIPVFEQLQQGKRVILEIELEGARQVRNSAPDALQIFVLPPSFDELERRIRARGQDSEAAIAQRLARARIEMAAADEFDLCLVNDDLVKAQQTLEEILYSK
jgi:guanylate kinase